MVNASDAITLARSYDPYGVVRSNAQLIASPYGYTGEFTESTGMVYLRARHYNPGQGRFMSRDTWAGDASNRMSFNRWNYVSSNPINYTDPTGHFACPSGDTNCITYVNINGTTMCVGMDGKIYPVTQSSVVPIPLIKKLLSEMHLSDAGLAFILLMEGYFDKPYNDGNNFRTQTKLFYDTSGHGLGNCTIGYGYLIHNEPCNGSSNEKGIWRNGEYISFDNMSKEIALKLIEPYISGSEKYIKSHITAPLNQEQFDVLVSLYFNWEPKDQLDKVNLINERRYEEAGLHLLKGPITGIGAGDAPLPGLVHRRYEESKLFLKASGSSIVLPPEKVFQDDPNHFYEDVLKLYYPK